MAYRFQVPPGWPTPPPGWTPPEGWVPDPSWPAAPAGWQFWHPVDFPASGEAATAPGTNAISAGIYARGHNGQVYFDGRFVTIGRKGFIARTRVGKGEKRIPVSQVTAVQWKPAGLVMGYIQFTVAGGVEIRSRFGRQGFDANHDENSVTFRGKSEQAFARVRAAIEQAMVAREGSAQSVQPNNRFDDLAKLAELRKAGVLTFEEFEAQKAILLRSQR
jgi:Domain of unknown function (DUF4429)